MFHRFALRVSEMAGSPLAFALAVGVVLAWAAVGVVVGFSDTHQLLINTGTTIVTFLMVFVLQHTQVAHERALHKKLDDLLRAIPDADDSLRGIEEYG